MSFSGSAARPAPVQVAPQDDPAKEAERIAAERQAQAEALAGGRRSTIRAGIGDQAQEGGTTLGGGKRRGRVARALGL